MPENVTWSDYLLLKRKGVAPVADVNTGPLSADSMNPGRDWCWQGTLKKLSSSAGISIRFLFSARHRLGIEDRYVILHLFQSVHIQIHHVTRRVIEKSMLLRSLG